MRRAHAQTQIRAFTLIELLIVIAIIGVLASMLFPAIGTIQKRGRNVLCLAQLQQVGVASHDQSVSANRSPAALQIGTNSPSFNAIVSGMSSAHAFLCPSDTRRPAGSNTTVLNDMPVSYFISRSTPPDEPTTIVAGDRNFTYQPSALPPARVTGDVTLIITNKFGWTRAIHDTKGNILQSDGSAQLTTSATLNRLMALQPGPTATWFVPNGNLAGSN